ncbi:MAG: ABC transporter ATP-binding protein [Bacillati bacterium ANGP1]|uniref:ABC transporter ATP-binding protein n=1 Tax=Candidatus Segetimicrobium genomatis TaxID=2569760 RepID=A0A537JU10_9BACT|nr:MAG: ABC transporter ATP-binding protein [Terrabacteria group bacterium ANGP1]
MSQHNVGGDPVATVPRSAGRKSPRIVVDRVGKSFRRGAVAALQECSLEIQPSEVLCVIGPSGCGKTTLLRIIDGLIRPDTGRVLADGEEITRPRRDLAMVFQHFGLFPWKTVSGNVAYGLRVQGRPDHEVRATVRHYLEMVGLQGFEGHYPYQLSGGMQQRVGLARAFAVDPSVLLMDEPFGSLDAQTREVMQGELLRLWRIQRKTLVFVTHSIDEAIILGDRVALMTHRPGRIKELIDVGIPRPRDPEAVRGSPRYATLRRYIWNELKPEVARSGEAP